jgi:hypothetical protein
MTGDVQTTYYLICLAIWERRTVNAFTKISEIDSKADERGDFDWT